MEAAATKRVLVVEDDSAIRLFLTDALQDEGYEVMAAANGVQALELLAAQQLRPDVIVLDMLMPAMDGNAFAEAYRHAPEPHAPIVVVTAYRSQGQRALVQGAEEMLLKPVDLNALLDQVARQARTAHASHTPLLNSGRLALLLVAGLIGLAAAATPVLAQARPAPAQAAPRAAAVAGVQAAAPQAHARAVDASRVETTSIAVDAHGIPVRYSR